MAAVREVAPPLPPPGAVRQPRAGRDLPAAIGVGVGLGALLTVPLFTLRPVFLAIVAVASAYGVLELVRALRRSGAHPPLVPLLLGAPAAIALGYVYGAGALAAVLAGVVVGVFAWRILPALRGVAPPGDGWLVRDVCAGVFAAAYVPFLTGFCALLAAPSDGPRRVTAFIVTTVCCDVGGYAAGVLSGGRHKLAPLISPGKSWEGLVGSLVACVGSGLVFLGPVLHRPLWTGVVFGLAVGLCAVLGDLAESALKRDLGVKDMGALLPGHGGMLDRLDSLLLTAPVAWLLLTALAPVS